MAKQRNIQQELNEAGTTSMIFMESYNKNLPQGFRIASLKILEKFQAAHPMLFKDGGEWSIDKHRKRFMDWISSYNDDK